MRGLTSGSSFAVEEERRRIQSSRQATSDQVSSWVANNSSSDPHVAIQFPLTPPIPLESSMLTARAMFRVAREAGEVVHEEER